MSTIIPIIYSEVDTYFEKITTANTDDNNKNLGDVKKVINADVVSDSIRNILRTRKGERVMLPTFGSNVGNILFDPMSEDVANMIYNEVVDAITKWEDRISIENVMVDPDYNNQLYIVHIQFRMIAVSAELHHLTIKLEI